MMIYLLTNSNFVGDNNQLNGIKLEIQNKFKDQQLEFQQVEEAEFNFTLLSKGDFVFVSGSHGLSIAEVIKKNLPAIQIFWSGHQYFDEFDTIKHLPDIVALPETALSESKKIALKTRTKLIITAGVAHCVNNHNVDEEYTRFNEHLPNHVLFPIQVGIILAGDAPQPNGQMKYFTRASAEEQANLIVKYIKINDFDQPNAAIMITNGPRTGKHDSITGKAHTPDPHHNGQRDDISEAFLNELKTKINHAQIVFYDFQFNALKNGFPSAYKPMIKQVVDSQLGLWFVSSDSTSMVSEGSFLLEKGKPVIIYHPSSENLVHLAHATDALTQGAVDLANWEEKSLQLPRRTTESAATKIAQVFCKQYLKEKYILSNFESSFFGVKNKSGNPVGLAEGRHNLGYF